MSNVQLIVGQLIIFLLFNIGGIRHGIHVEAEQKIHAHAHARAQNGQQARQAGNQKDAHGLPIAREERSEIDVDHANE